MNTYDFPETFIGADGQPKIGWTPTPQEIITKQVIDKIAGDREGKFRQALIDLGWTPPVEKSKDI